MSRHLQTELGHKSAHTALGCTWSKPSSGTSAPLTSPLTVGRLSPWTPTFSHLPCHPPSLKSNSPLFFLGSQRTLPNQALPAFSICKAQQAKPNQMRSNSPDLIDLPSIIKYTKQNAITLSRPSRSTKQHKTNQTEYDRTLPAFSIDKA